MLGGFCILISSWRNCPWDFPIISFFFQNQGQLWKLRTFYIFWAFKQHPPTFSPTSLLYINTTVVLDQTKSELSVSAVVSMLPLHPLMLSCCLCIFISLSPTPSEVINNFKCVWCIKDIWKSSSSWTQCGVNMHFSTLWPTVTPRFLTTFWKSLNLTLFGLCFHLAWTDKACETRRKLFAFLFILMESVSFGIWHFFVASPDPWRAAT